MTGPVLILGGTAEARRLAERLAPARRVITSLAGRTGAPTALPGETRIGGFGGVAGLAAYLRAHRVVALIDATHPYAARMAANAAAAALDCGTPLLRYDRPTWQPKPGDKWVEYDDLIALAAALPNLGRHALVTLGGADLSALSGALGMRLTLRAIDPPARLPDHPDLDVILDRGPFDLAGERALLSQRGIDVLVSRNAGGQATRAKLDAARDLGIPVALLRRPVRPVTASATEMEAVLRWIEDAAPIEGE
ncbi:cobalt-precorrin-6A reductase [Pacificispira sp.]|uniref:cobalt-precorrin-6A reductase n=1 Tax=Pacificispira sp. TaxID=2888761 RepID=UPI003BAD3017